MDDPLVTYLRGKLDHERLVAQAALDQDSAWWWDDPDCDSPAEQHIAMWRPEHALRVIAGQLAVVDRHRPTPSGRCGSCDDGPDRTHTWPCADIRSVAAVYHDLPDFNPAWLPADR